LCRVRGLLSTCDRLLGKSYGAGSNTICAVLDRHGIERRSQSERQRKLTDEQETEICLRYDTGTESTYELAKAFGVTAVTIGNILDCKGIERRSQSEAQRKFTDKQEAEICQRYVAGESSVELGVAFGCSSWGIRKILDRKGIKRRTRSELRRKFTDKQEAEIRLRYKSGGESTVDLGRAYETTFSTIVDILNRHGIKCRSQSERQRKLTDKQESDVCQRYLAGENTVDLGRAYGVTDGTIGRTLDRHGIERRECGGFGDSVQHVLDGTGLHVRGRESEFYLCELARYGGTHCKPGIAFDTDVRVAVGQGEYGAEVLRLFFATRAEAYFLEQAVLDATRDHYDCPDDLADWSGASEVRAMPAEDLLPTIDRLAAELEEMGPWEFAAAYVPMTAAQRAACHQRATASAPVCTTAHSQLASF